MIRKSKKKKRWIVIPKMKQIRVKFHLKKWTKL